VEIKRPAPCEAGHAAALAFLLDGDGERG
jgi:hypothetical protein